MTQPTSIAFHQAVGKAKNVFVKKTKDYGTAWRVLRDISVVDQIYIKVKRICTLQEVKQAQIADSIIDEWIAIINYAVIGLIQREKNNTEIEDIALSEVEAEYDRHIAYSFSLMEKKNHDYGEAWRDMHAKSIADICMMKVNRMRQILENDEQLLASEGLEANYFDLINYAIFYLILFDH